ncbi:hypothetical protein MOV08_16815 [Streptomyces yunnanensis]|uniref:Uncharacterized protein n=1 Tax=Streptomyces yunnanensis TaxID=156453 RepID=A0ABY8A916_9ACTN|nr:hypothetical protein [Streptomyces yunnanensis]WEB40776.1 hypothetical protein MOV08_16815 [Streptomyces yunnanensis]
MTHSAPDGRMAGTVGNDVITVHELVWAGEDQRPKCGDGGPDDEVVEWLRPVNCIDCLGE